MNERMHAQMLGMTLVKPANGKLVSAGCLLLFPFYLALYKVSFHHKTRVRIIALNQITEKHLFTKKKKKWKRKLGGKNLSQVCVGLFGKENNFTIIADLLMFAVVLISLTQTKQHLIWEKLLWTCNLKRREMEQTFFMQCLGCG